MDKPKDGQVAELVRELQSIAKAIERLDHAYSDTNPEELVDAKLTVIMRVKRAARALEQLGG
jgi:hypothetical protein